MQIIVKIHFSSQRYDVPKTGVGDMPLWHGTDPVVVASLLAVENLTVLSHSLRFLLRRCRITVVLSEDDGEMVKSLAVKYK